MTQKYFYEPDDNSTLILQHLTVNGDGTGSDNAIGDYSSAATDFYIQPPAGEVFVIHRLIGAIEDSGNFTTVTYGAASAVSNGVQLLITDSSDSTILSLTENDPITNNGRWTRRAYSTALDSWGAGNSVLKVYLEFNSGGRPIILKNQEKLKMVYNDDFTALVGQHFVAQGFKGYGKAGNA